MKKKATGSKMYFVVMGLIGCLVLVAFITFAIRYQTGKSAASDQAPVNSAAKQTLIVE